MMKRIMAALLAVMLMMTAPALAQEKEIYDTLTLVALEAGQNVIWFDQLPDVQMEQIFELYTDGTGYTDYRYEGQQLTSSVTWSMIDGAYVITTIGDSAMNFEDRGEGMYAVYTGESYMLYQSTNAQGADTASPQTPVLPPYTGSVPSVSVAEASASGMLIDPAVYSEPFAWTADDFCDAIAFVGNNLSGVNIAWADAPQDVDSRFACMVYSVGGSEARIVYEKSTGAMYALEASFEYTAAEAQDAVVGRINGFISGCNVGYLAALYLDCGKDESRFVTAVNGAYGEVDRVVEAYGTLNDSTPVVNCEAYGHMQTFVRRAENGRMTCGGAYHNSGELQ